MRKKFSFIAVDIRSGLYNAIVINPDSMVFNKDRYSLVERDPSCFTRFVVVPQFM